MDLDILSDFSHALNKQISEDIKTDSVTKKLYSTDASIYQIEPLGVFTPRTSEHLNAIVELAHAYKIPILPRGSGSSLAGQAVGAAVIIDCSRYLTKIVNVNPEEKSAIVEPGVILDDFNRVASTYGLKYGPDPASSDRATFGGMLGNNSTGAHSIQFGMTADNVISIRTILSDGSVATLNEIPILTATQRAKEKSIEGRLYRSTLHIRTKYEGEIRERWPDTWRRSSGYSLNYLLPWSSTAPPQWHEQEYPRQIADHINLAPLFVGSEGTLAVFQEAKINLVSTPKHTILGALSFQSVSAACDATPDILARRPSAIELIPRALIERARSVPAYADLLWFVHGNPAAILIVEFSGDDKNLLFDQVQKLHSNVVIAESPKQQDQIWKVRKVGLGLLMSRPGDVKPLPFVEDVAVPVERLGEFVREFERIMASHGTEGDFYAHASAGCLHVRPLINLKTSDGRESMRAIAEEVVELTIRLGGAFSGEHGDGLARSEWLEMIYGPSLMNAFVELKQAADPAGIMNPGKIVLPEKMDENLRYVPDYRTKIWQPIFDFSAQGGLASAIEMCNGAGVCRKIDGVMCPSYQATKDEMHSTRGRANLLRGMISGRFPADQRAESAVFEALDLCLECKGCKAECPSGVDMAKLKYEFLHQYYQHHRRPLRDYLFSRIATIASIGQVIAPISNALAGNAILRSVADRLFGISKQRRLPKLRRAANYDDFESSSTSEIFEHVIYLQDAFTKYFYPEISEAAHQTLTAAGSRVHDISTVGAGRTLISKGFLTAAKKHAQKVAREVKIIDPKGRMAIVGVEPSEIYTMRDEYPELFPEDEEFAGIAERSFMLEEFLLRPNPFGRTRIDLARENLELDGDNRVVQVFGHCYQKAQPPATDGYPFGEEATVEMLRSLGYQPKLIESGCCGMAGSFGYESNHYDLSMQIGEMHLFPAIRSMEDEMLVVAPGVSCRAQIESGTNHEVIHPVQLFANPEG